MSDLISREDAIKAVTIAVLADKDEIEALEALPSAEGGDAELTVIPEGTGLMQPCPDNGADLISRDKLNECIKYWYEHMGVDLHGVWNKQLAEIVKGMDEDDLALEFRFLRESIRAIQSADAVSMEEHIKELNDLAVEWKAKFAKAEKITDEIYDEAMAKVANECKECKERLQNLRPSADAEPKWNCTANFVAEQLEKLKDMTDEERIKLLHILFPSADAEPSLKAIKRQIDEHWYLDPPSDEAEQTIHHIENNTKESDLVYRPSAEAVQGEWIKDEDFHGIVYKCSNCGRICVSAVSYDIKGDKWQYNFCPNCGARMKGGDTE